MTHIFDATHHLFLDEIQPHEQYYFRRLFHDLIFLTGSASLTSTIDGAMCVSSSLPSSETVLGFKSTFDTVFLSETCISMVIALTVIGSSTCFLPSCMNVYVLDLPAWTAS